MGVASSYVRRALPEGRESALGAEVKAAEIQFHHEVTNQYLWSKF